MKLKNYMGHEVNGSIATGGTKQQIGDQLFVAFRADTDRVGSSGRVTFDDEGQVVSFQRKDGGSPHHVIQFPKTQRNYNGIVDGGAKGDETHPLQQL